MAVKTKTLKASLFGNDVELRHTKGDYGYIWLGIRNPCVEDNASFTVLKRKEIARLKKKFKKILRAGAKKKKKE
jgi:hypothetical protein